MRKDRSWKRTALRALAVIALIIAVAIGGFIWWAKTPYAPTDIALADLESDDIIDVETYDDFITFSPKDDTPRLGVILYPGGRVDFRAYAPLARSIALNGYQVTIVEMPLNLAVLDPDRADVVIETYPEIIEWVVGGHSLGGAMAASYAESHQESVGAVILFAAYPPSNADLSDNEDQLAISLYGTLDGIVSEENFSESMDLLPEMTKIVPIPGGNHAQFGEYGAQSGDNPATITGDEQRYFAAQTIALELRPFRLKTLTQ